MGLREKLENDIKSAMRNHDQARLDALRFLKFAVQAVVKDKKSELDDAVRLKDITKHDRNRRERLKAWEEGGPGSAAAT